MVTSPGHGTNEWKKAFDGRVAVIVGASVPGALQLATRLAETGVDVAAVYLEDEDRNIDRDAERMKSVVEALGRQCLIIRREADSRDFAQQMIDLVRARFQRLDFYFDYSQASGGQAMRASHDNGPTGPGMTHVKLLVAALNEHGEGEGGG